MRKIQSSIAWKLSLTMMAMLLILGAAIIAISLYFYQRDVFDSNAELAQAIAETAAACIDGDAYDALANAENDYWEWLKSFFDAAKTSTDAMYLYGLGIGSDGDIPYIVEGMKPDDDPADVGVFGEVEGPGIFAEETFETLQSGAATRTSIYNSEGFGYMVSGFAPIRNASGRVVGVVGADISVHTVFASVRAFAIGVVSATLLVLAPAMFFIVRYTNRKVGVPIRTLANVAQRISEGDASAAVERIDTGDEVGFLSTAFERMQRAAQRQLESLEHIANGDYTRNIDVRSNRDHINMAIDKIINNNVDLIASINEAAMHLSHGARQIAQSAQHLAEGSSRQAESLQELTKAVEEVRLQSDDSAGLAVKTADNVETAGNLMERSMGYMGDMTQAMTAIDDSSKSIAKVIKVIDDIAFQTNILALNAAVEAARAGQHGKGFAVVADEVRNLASKSASAAKETETLIAASLSSVRVGGDVAKHTNDSLMQVHEISAGNIENMSKLKAASTSQNFAINEITENIANISGVVVSNTEAVHESAAAVQEMSAQAVILEQMVARFRLPTQQEQAALDAALRLPGLS